MISKKMNSTTITMEDGTMNFDRIVLKSKMRFENRILIALHGFEFINLFSA